MESKAGKTDLSDSICKSGNSLVMLAEPIRVTHLESRRCRSLACEIDNFGQGCTSPWKGLRGTNHCINDWRLKVSWSSSCIMQIHDDNNRVSEWYGMNFQGITKRTDDQISIQNNVESVDEVLKANGEIKIYKRVEKKKSRVQSKKRTAHCSDAVWT